MSTSVFGMSPIKSLHGGLQSAVTTEVRPGPGVCWSSALGQRQRLFQLLQVVDGLLDHHADGILGGQE